MTKKIIITYGTFDLLHQGHINLLKKAKELGDYLIVGVTNDRFDRERGKLSVRNNVLERVESVKATGIADKVIIEDYVGQKIDDIQKYNVDIFAIGSDWDGHFDYLKEYCKVVYLPRTQGISSTILREQNQKTIQLGIIGCGRMGNRLIPEAGFVENIKIIANYDINQEKSKAFANAHNSYSCSSEDELLDKVDAVYIATPHLEHYQSIKKALTKKKHVLCETPMVLKTDEAKELFSLAESQGVVLLEANKTAFCPAFTHLIVMIKSGIIGEVVDIDASLSQLLDKNGREFDPQQAGGSMNEECSLPLLPIVKILGTNFENIHFYSRMENGVDIFTKGVICYPNATCSFKVALGVKTEGDLVISGTKGYAYVPAPWWRTDYFELRFENINENKKFFYKWDGDGLRYEIQEFISCIINNRLYSVKFQKKESIFMAHIFNLFNSRKAFQRL